MAVGRPDMRPTDSLINYLGRLQALNNLPVNDDWPWSVCWYPALHLQTKCPGRLTHSLLSEQSALRLGISHSLISAGCWSGRMSVSWVGPGAAKGGEQI